MKEANSEAMMLEKYSLLRQNYWTGLRLPNNGRNWMTYYCLLRKTKYNAPLDCIMYLINEYLNWIPARCWSLSVYTDNNCPICNCRFWGGDIVNVPITTCSYSCLEQYSRNGIIKDRYHFQSLMNLFKSYPISVLSDAEYIIDEEDYILENQGTYKNDDGFHEDCYYNHIPIKWWHDSASNSDEE